MIPLSSTTISILRLSQSTAWSREGYGPSDSQFTPVATGVRAVISAPGGTESVRGGEQAVTSFRLNADPCDLGHVDRVLDETSGQTYLVDWVIDRTGFGLDHVVAQLRRIEGLA